MLTVVGTFGLVAAVILAAVFAAAGVAKLADPDGTRTAVREFGAPRSLVYLLAVVLPLAELAVAFLLLPGPTRAAGGAGALALLGVFTVAIAANLARGRTPDCHCFGRLHSAPASWKTLARNGLLAGLAGTTLAAGLTGETPSAVTWVGTVGITGLLALSLGVTLVTLGAAGVMGFLSLLRSYGNVLVRLDGVERRLAAAGLEDEEGESGPAPELGLAPGTAAPAFDVPDVTGAYVSLDDLIAPGRPLLLLFTSPTCDSCHALLSQVAGWQDELADRLTIAVVSTGAVDTARGEARAHGIVRMLSDDGSVVFDAYEANATPSAVLVSPEGTISSWVAPGIAWIERLLDSALADGTDDDVPAVGTPAPVLTLVGLDGEDITFGGPADEDTLVLFWNPSCGFCSSMLDDLLAWEAHRPKGAPRLCVVSSGDADSTRAEGFTSALVLDHDSVASTAFGADGTPMGILLDREGLVASPLAAGAEAVLALAGGRAEDRAPELLVVGGAT